MHIPRYWARSDLEGLPKSRKGSGQFVCWGWSDQNSGEAKQKADERARLISQKFAAGELLNRYPYGLGNRPLREEVLHVDHAATRDGAVVITRNQYGALVLNSSQAMFIDLDFETHVKVPQAGGFFGRLFAKKPSNDELEKLSLETVRHWSAGRRDLGLRLYRTFGGIRCLVTNRPFDPAASETIQLLQSIGSDPLYIRLCQAQASFRARLTPKPWRCAVDRPPSQFPRVDPEQEMKFQQWKAEYEVESREFSVCRFIAHVGASGDHPEVAPVVQLHDRFTVNGTDRPLA
jgi:hypothetical protein